MKQKQRKSRHHRRRDPKHLIHDLSESYYDGIDSDIYGDIYGSKLSAEERNYIDPWDLENYDYVRKKLSAPSIDENSTPSPAGEPSISSQFLYLPNNNSMPDCMACFAGMDEQTFYNTKYETIFDDEVNMYSDFESPYSTDRNNSSCEEENHTMLSSLKLHTPGFGVAASGRRKLVLPKPIPHLEFPAPPPYDYCTPSYGDLIPAYSDCYECMSNIPIYGTGSSIYGTGGGYSSYGSSLSQPSSLYSTYSNRFEISKKGLLQIDYSCNWNDLDRLIGKEI